jgi:predicted dienelactone hydrolase
VRRPQNVPWLIDYVAGLNAGEGPLAGLVDTDRVVVSGLSYGGYTALAASGAQLNWEGLQTLCNEDRSNPALVSIMLGFNFCDVLLPAREPLADLAGVDASQAGLWPVLGDPRVQAIVPISPAFWPVIGPEGLQNVTVPMLIVGGSGDTLIPPTWDAFYDEVSSAQKAEVIFADANHLLAGPACSTMPWALDVGIFWACSDAVWDMDRAHDLINHFTTAFLLSTLKGDTDATATLAPDAVAFPGIEYQAEGF